MYELALFAGGGGGILAGKMLGWRCIGAVEIAEHPRAVLLQRQNDRSLPPFPVWDDVRTFSAGNPECAGYFETLRSLRNRLVISGGFPCQDISVAGKGAGLDGAQSGLYKEYYRIVCEVRPAVVYMENSPALTNRGLGRILAGLSEVGYDAQWGVLGADDLGAPHDRKRIWIVANSKEAVSQGSEAKPHGFRGRFTDSSNEIPDAGRYGWQARRRDDGEHEWPKPDASCQQFGAEEMGYADKDGCETKRLGQLYRGSLRKQGIPPISKRSSWWEVEPSVGRVVDGMAGRVGQLEILGNGQVPAVAAAAFAILHSLSQR